MLLDPKDARRDNVRLTLHSDDDQHVHHHFRGYEVMRLIEALNQALAFGPPIPSDHPEVTADEPTGRRRR